jgi:penicillin-binding protein 1A
VESQPPLLNESVRAVDARNAFMMDRLLQEVARSGTAARSQRDLKRPDLYGKTGTTNDSIDTWFNGFHPTLAAIVWMGYDTPRSLGDRETGGGLSLPIWISFMETALKGVPIMEPAAPEGVVNIGGEWYYEEYARGGGVGSLGVSSGGLDVNGAGVDPNGVPRPKVPGPSGEQSPGLPGDKSMNNADGLPPPRNPAAATEEKRSILDLFKN